MQQDVKETREAIAEVADNDQQLAMVCLSEGAELLSQTLSQTSQQPPGRTSLSRSADLDLILHTGLFPDIHQAGTLARLRGACLVLRCLGKF